MDTHSKIKTGWIIVGVAFGIAMIIMSIMNPDAEAEEECEELRVIPEGDKCETILDDKATTNALLGWLVQYSWDSDIMLGAMKTFHFRLPIQHT
jgi:hypothetical protein